MSTGTGSPSGTVVLAGAHGHGRWHLQNLRRLSERADIRLVGVCDPRPLDAGLRELTGDVPVSPRLDDLVAQTAADVAIICTPIHTHTELTLAAVRAGAHVLLEKPPAPTLADFERLVAGVEASGLACQVGFQSLGSAAVPYVRTLVEQGAIGRVRGIGGACTWVRDSTYYGRAAWAGRRAVDGVPVVDGALTNPFAHAVASALAVAGATGPAALDSVEVELYHANPIEADDTSCLRARTSSGTEIVVAATLAGERPHEPRLTIHGETGRITLEYKTGRVRLESEGRDESTSHPGTDLLVNLLDHVHDPSVPLIVPLPETRAFMEVVEAVRCAPDPLEIPPEHRREERADGATRRVVPGIDAVVERCAESLRLFSELDVAWARPGTTVRPGASPAGTTGR